MTWWQFLPEVLVALAVLFIPGLLLGVAARIPVRFAVFAAPAGSVFLIAVGAMILPFIDVGWSLASFSAFAAVAVVSTLIVRVVVRLLVRPDADALPKGAASGGSWVWAATGFTVGAGLICAQLFRIFGRPDAISQSYDNIFHLNAVRYIAASGNGSSLTLNELSTGLPGLNFYPAAWHDAVALVFSVFPDSIPAATNAMTVAVAGFVWPAAIVFLAMVFKPVSRLFVLSAGAMSACFLAFPGLMLKWGVLYPNMMSYAMLPVVVGLALLWVRSVDSWRLRPLVFRSLAISVALVAVGLAHPNGLTSAAVLVLPIFVGAAWTWWRNPSAALRRAPRLVVLVLAIAASLGMWGALRPAAAASTWPPKLPSGQAAGEFLTNSFDGNIAAVGLSAMVLGGVYVVFRQKHSYWLVASWALTGVLWVVVASLTPGALRSALTGSWYNDSYRLAALTVVPSLLLAALGFSAALEWLRVRVPRLTGAGTVTSGVSAIVCVLVAVVLTLTPSARGATVAVQREFAETPDSLLVTTDEKNVLDDIDSVVGPDDVIAVNPWDGSALAYALSDREVTQFHTLGATRSQYSSIPAHLKDFATDPAVCEQVRDGNVRWYLHFEDTLGIGDWAADSFEGFDGVIDSGAVRPVLISGPVGLYEIVGCS